MGQIRIGHDRPDLDHFERYTIDISVQLRCAVIEQQLFPRGIGELYLIEQ